MSAEDFREDVSHALQKAVAGGADPDDLRTVLEEMQNRIGRLEAVRGGPQ